MEIDVIQVINLAVMIAGGGIGFGLLSGKVTALSKQVNAGFQDNRDDHRIFFLRLGGHDVEIANLMSASKRHTRHVNQDQGTDKES